MNAVGQPLSRFDGRLKVTGAARYTADISIQGAVHASIVSSSIAHGRTTAIDTTAAETSAEELRHDVNLFRWYAEHDRHQIPTTEDVLGRFIQRQCAVAIPNRSRCVRFHLIVVAI